MAKLFSGFMAILAFFVTCVSGLAAGMDAEALLLRALAALAIFFILGLMAGAVAERILAGGPSGEKAPAAEQKTEESSTGAA